MFERLQHAVQQLVQGVARFRTIGELHHGMDPTLPAMILMVLNHLQTSAGMLNTGCWRIFWPCLSVPLAIVPFFLCHAGLRATCMPGNAEPGASGAGTSSCAVREVHSYIAEMLDTRLFCMLLHVYQFRGFLVSPSCRIATVTQLRTCVHVCVHAWERRRSAWAATAHLHLQQQSQVMR